MPDARPRRRRLLARLYATYRAVQPWAGLVAAIVGTIAAAGTLAGLLPPVLDRAAWPRITNAVLWFLVAGQGFDWIGQWLEDETD